MQSDGAGGLCVFQAQRVFSEQNVSWLKMFVLCPWGTRSMALFDCCSQNQSGAWGKKKANNNNASTVKCAFGCAAVYQQIKLNSPNSLLTAINTWKKQKKKRCGVVKWINSAVSVGLCCLVSTGGILWVWHEAEASESVSERFGVSVQYHRQWPETSIVARI